MLAALVALTLTLMPVSSHQSTLEWTGISTTGGNPVVLATAPLEALDVELGCQAAMSLAGEAKGRQRVFGTAADAGHPGVVSLTTDSTGMTWGTTQRNTTIEIPALVPSDCRVRASYNSEDNSFSLRVGERTEYLSGAFPQTASNTAATGPILTSFWTADSVRPSTRVTAVLHPSTVQWPAWRWMLVLTGLTALGLALLATTRRRVPEMARRVGESLRPNRFDALVLSALLISWLSTPPFYDDGWVLTTNREFPNVGFFSNYYSVGAAPQLQGLWWSLIERFWLFQDSPPLLIRLPAALLTWMTWIYVRKRVIARIALPEASRAATVIAASVVTVFAFAWLPTLRPEVMVSLLIAVSYGIFLATSSWTPARLSVIFAIGALGVTLHQTGLMLVAPCLFAAVTHLRRGVGRQPAWIDIGWATAFGGSLLLIVLMIRASLGTIAWSAVAFSAESGHNNLLNEIERLEQLSTSNTPGRVWTAALLVLAVAAFVMRTDRATEPAKTAGYLAATTAGMLLLTSSKWEGHFGAVWVPTIVLATAALSSSWGWIAARRTTLAPTAAVAACVAVALTIVGRGYFWTFSPWQSGAPGGGTRIVALLVLAATLTTVAWLAGRRSDYRVLGPVVAGNLAVAALLCITAFVTVDEQTYAARSGDSGRPTFSEGFAPSTSPRYSWPRILPKSCGVADTMQVAANPVSLLPDWTLTAGSATAIEGEPQRRIPGATPVPGTAVFARSAPGEAITPWFGLGPVRTVQWWVEAVRSDTTQYVEFLRDDGTLLPRQTLTRRGDEGTWQLYRVDVPATASHMRLSYLPEETGVSTTTGLVDATETAAARTVVFGSVWRNPDEVFLYPCAPMPTIKRGYFQNFDWSLGNPRFTPSGTPMTPLPAEAVMVEQACATSNHGRSTCLFRNTYPLVKSMKRSEATVLIR
jgi:hypothetical protein